MKRIAYMSSIMSIAGEIIWKLSVARKRLGSKITSTNFAS